MAAARAQVPVPQGPQVWRLLRTDRDGASSTEIPDFAAAAVRYFLRGPTAQGPLPELVPVRPGEWRFGNVRPLHVLTVTKTEPPMPAGQLVAARERSVPGTVPTVRATRPWWIVVRFWWRGPVRFVDYPGMVEGLLGRRYELNGADWVLDRAVILRGDLTPDPGDSTWTEATGQQLSEAASGLGKTLLTGGIGLGLVALAWLMSRRR